MKTGQSNLGQHQQLRCFGIPTEIKTKNNQLGKAVAWTKTKRRGKMSCEPEFLTTVKFRQFKTTEMARKNESQSDYKEFISHCSLEVCQEARTLASQGVVTHLSHIITGWTHGNWSAAARTAVMPRFGFKDIFKGGKGAFCTTYTWLTVLRGPRKDSYVQNCLRSVYNKDEQSCLHSCLRSSWIYFLRISGEPTYKLWKIWTKSSSFQLCR